MVASTSSLTRRADAQRNIDAIVRAAMECLSRRPDASVAEIAKCAGVGRVTLYGHFSSRAVLVDAALRRAVELGDAILDSVDLHGDPRQVLDRLIKASWQLVNQFRGILAAAQAELPPGRIREAHANPAVRVEQLIARGQAEGGFRTDLSTPWLVATLQNIMHGAADEIEAGRLAEADAARYISATVLAAFTPPRALAPGPPSAT